LSAALANAADRSNDMTQTEKMLSRREGGSLLDLQQSERHNAVSWTCGPRPPDPRDFSRDDEVRVVVVTGAGGKAFISGADISRFGDERSTERRSALHARRPGQLAFYDFPKPTIAMIRLLHRRRRRAGGVLRPADLLDNSRFAIPAAKLGVGYR